MDEESKEEAVAAKGGYTRLSQQRNCTTIFNINPLPMVATTAFIRPKIQER